MKNLSRKASAFSFSRFKFHLFLIPLLLLTTQCAKERVLPVEEEKESLIFDLSTIEDSEIRNFLDYKYLSGVNPHLARVLEARGGEEELIQEAITSLYELDKKQGFIKHLKKKYGIPIWDRYDMLTSKAGDPVPCVALAFPDGQETTAFFVIIPRGKQFQFRLVKKDKIDDHIEKNKSWENLGFAVLESTFFDMELFDNPRQSYLDWLKTNEENLLETEGSLENRGCQYVETVKCYDRPFAIVGTAEDLESRNTYCYTYHETVCDGGDSSCMECDGGTDTGGSTSGGSSGSSGSGDGSGTGPGDATSESIDDQLDYISQMVGLLSSSQRSWLESNTNTLYALGDIATNGALTTSQKADAIFDHFTKDADPILTAIQMAQEVAYLSAKNPSWSSTRVVFTAAWNVTSGTVHTVLDLVGLVPALGEGADFVNGVFYLLEGDKSNAAFSFAAMVPFAGWVSTGAKYAGKVVKTAKGFTAELKFVVSSSGTITFGRSSQLVTVIGKMTNHQAHHLIPWSKNSHKVIQKAADSGDWHPNLAKNGMNLDLSIHSGYSTAHSIYNTRVGAALDDILDQYGNNISPQDAAQALEELADDIRAQLNQGKKLDEITF